MRGVARLAGAVAGVLAVTAACGDAGAPGMGPGPVHAAPPAGSPAAPAAAAGPGRPSPRRDLDVVLIVIDTLRADALGCYGSPLDTSPTIDALAAAGVRVADVTAQSSWTAPSMVSLMLSRHVADNFVRMPPPPTLAERLQAAGFRTAAFVDNILLAPGTGFDRGFDTYLIEPGPRQILPVLRSDDPRPLFAYFHFVDPHDPYAPLPEFDRFAPGPLPAAMHADFRAALQARADMAPDADPDAGLDAALEAELQAAAREAAEALARYAGDVRQADQRVHFVREALAATGRLEHTLLVLAADHGECLWQHREAESLLTPEKRAGLLTTFKMTHNSVLYEELLAVPLIFSGAGLPAEVPAGLVLPGPAQNVDIVPTLLELLGLPVPAELEGRSLLPDMRSPARGARPAEGARTSGDPPGGDTLLRANTAVFTSLRDGAGWKLIVPWDPAGPDRPQLFFLPDDPHERRPLSLPPADPAARAAAEALARALEDYRRNGLRAERSEDVIDADTRARMEELGYIGR